MGFGGRRNKKRRRGMGGGMGGMGGGNPGFQPSRSFRPADYALPSDEELEREAAELEATLRATDSSKALKEALSINELQRMAIEELWKIAEGEGLQQVHQCPSRT